MQSHGASQVLGLNALLGEPTSCNEDDEQLNLLKSVQHQVEGIPGMVLQGHLIEGQSIKKWLGVELQPIQIAASSA